MGKQKNRLKHELWYVEQRKKLTTFKEPHLFSRERVQKEAFGVQAMLSRLGDKAVVIPEISLITRHRTGIFEVWTEKGRRKKK